MAELLHNAYNQSYCVRAKQNHCLQTVSFSCRSASCSAPRRWIPFAPIPLLNPRNHERERCFRAEWWPHFCGGGKLLAASTILLSNPIHPQFSAMNIPDVSLLKLPRNVYLASTPTDPSPRCAFPFLHFLGFGLS